MRVLRNRNEVLSFAVVAVGLWLAAAQSARGQHAHTDDFIVGRTEAGQLAVEFDFGESQVLPAVQGLLNGFAIDDPGFMALEMDEPEEDLFTLGEGASIVMQVVSLSPALSVWTPFFASRLDQPGETWTVGGASFDEHPTWHVDATHPLFDPLGGPWSATFRLLDLGTTGYSASADYIVTFVPEPGMLMLLSVGAISLFRRSRR